MKKIRPNLQVYYPMKSEGNGEIGLQLKWVESASYGFDVCKLVYMLSWYFIIRYARLMTNLDEVPWQVDSWYLN